MATKKNINDYNYYDRGYSTGSQTSIFVGPIWVEEALSINIASTSNDVPVYPYSSEYFNRLLLGRYIVTGTFAIPFIKPNYLLNILKQANSTQLSQTELKSMIEDRTNVFTRTVAAKIEKTFNDPTKVSRADISAYVRRVSREIELASHGFDLTIIQGDVYGETSSIEIYQNVKITGVQKGLLNDDETVVELYSFTAQRMPDKKKKLTEDVPAAERYVLKKDVLSTAKEIVKDIVHETFTYPEIRVITPTRRAGLVYNTDKMAITGPLNESSRSFGKTVSFKELIYSYKYPLSFNLLNPTTTIPDDTLVDGDGNSAVIDGRKKRYHLPIWRKSTKELAEPFIEGYADPNVTNISNEQGAIVSLDRTLSAKYICAAAQIAPIPKSVPVNGGSIIVRRTKATNADIGSFVPPTFVSNSAFTCGDGDLDGLRYGVMWNTLIGCRSSGKSYSGTSGKDDKAIRDVGKPVLSIGYIASTDIAPDKDKTGWTYTISAPVYLDYVDTHISSLGEGKSKKPILVDDWREKSFVITGTSDGSVSIKQPDGTTIKAMEGNHWVRENTMGPVVAAYYDKIVVGQPYSSIKPEEKGILDLVPDNVMRYLSKFHYKFFEITIPLVGKCGIDLNKALNIQPFVFTRDKSAQETIFTEEMRHSTDAIKILSAVAQKYEDNGKKDNSCEIDFFFDWSITSVSGDISGQSVTITGLYYVHKKDSDVSKSGSLIADVAFVATVLPMTDDLLQSKKDKETTNSRSEENVRLITDIKQNGGQYTELYSFVRCDVPSYYSVPMYHTETMTAIDVLKGSWIPYSPWSYTPVWGYMEDSGEIDYQYALFKKLLKQYVQNAAAVLPDVALNQREFDIEKDIACLETIIHNNMSPMAGFVRGYGFSVSPMGIYNAIRNITFTGSDLSHVNVFKKPAKTTTSNDTETSTSPITLGTAIDVYSLEDTVIQEIRKVILDESEIAGYTVSSDPLNNLSSTDSATPIYIETHVVTPAQEIVRTGLTLDGYDELTGSPTSIGSANSKTLKGYNIADGKII